MSEPHLVTEPDDDPTEYRERQRRDAAVYWVKCGRCNEFWCNKHKMHAFECPCPPIEEWDIDPYSAEMEE